MTDLSPAARAVLAATDPIRATLERMTAMASDELDTTEEWAHSRSTWDKVIAAARAALAAASSDGPAVPEGREPASVVSEPSDEELALIYHDCCRGCEFMDQGGFEDAARAVLARFGHHSPDATKMVSDAYQMGRRDASADSQQAAEAAEDEVAELALKELERTVVLLMPVTGHKKIKRFDTIRAALKRLHELENKADLSPAPPAPKPADGEVAELAVFLRGCADDHHGHGRRQFTRAADLLEQRHPAPVPVAVPEGREAAAIVGEPSDEELLKLARAELNNSPNWEEPEYDASNPFPYEAPGIAWLNFARAVLARWGHHSPDATKMVGPADGEVAELVARLRAIRNDYGMRHSADCRRAADLLEGLGSGWVVPIVEQFAPVPVRDALAAPQGLELKSRKFVQLMTDGDGCLCAVADDGTAWWQSLRERCWKQFDALPANDLPLPKEVEK